MIRTRVLRRLRSFATSDDSGAATVEFVILLPAVFLFIANTVESGIVLTRGAMLDQGLDIAVRDLRLGTEEPPTFEEFRLAVCAATKFMPDCIDRLQIELRPYTAADMDAMSSEVRCLDRAEEIVPLDETNFTPGVANEMMLIRACATYEPAFPKVGLGAAMPKDQSGDYRITALSAYVQEP